MSIRQRSIRVLVVDDSALVRGVLARGLQEHLGIEVVGAACDPYEARDILVRQKPDVITLDIEMPRMDGITFLRKYMAVLPTPTIVVSNLAAAESAPAVAALAAGAVDVMKKPILVGESPLAATRELAARILEAGGVTSSKLQRLQQESPRIEPAEERWTGPRHRVIAIGSSTGGVQALSRLLPQLPLDCPPIVMVQHIPVGFTHSLAGRLNEMARIEVQEGREGSVLRKGCAYLAPSNDQHTEVVELGSRLQLRMTRADKDGAHRPSVEALFMSVARLSGVRAGVILTGMGADGAKGLLALRRSGARTLAQDEDTCVIYGMPREANRLGAAEAVLPLSRIVPHLQEQRRRSNDPRASQRLG